MTSTVPSGSPSVANPPGGPDIVPVLIANPPVELRQPAAPATKPTGTTPVGGHLPPGNPVLGSRPLPRPNTGSDTGSNDREHANTPLPSNVPVSGNGFSLADAGTAPSVPASQPVPVSQPVPISQPTGAPTSPTADQPAGQLPVSHQLSGPVLSLRTAGNGSHQLTIALHPAELGPVNLHVKILGDSMTIQLASTSEGAHDALRDALPQLRQELQAAGLPNVDLSLDLGGAPSGGHAQAGGHTQTSGEQHEAGHQAERPISTAPRRSTTTESGLDRWL